MNRITCLCSIAVFASASAHVNGASPKGGDETIIIADELRSAFYQKAPSKMAAAIGKAVGLWCLTAERHQFADKSEANAKTVEWLCGSQKLHYFGNVYLTGETGPHGLACEDKLYKYLGVDMVAESIKFGWCVPAESDETVYQMHFENVNTGSDG
jgi:hypothetical protein